MDNTLIEQMPEPGQRLLKWVGDVLEIRAKRWGEKRLGRMVFRTNIGKAAVYRRELIAEVENDAPILGKDWHDLPMLETTPGSYRVYLPLLDVGIYSGKVCFLPTGSDIPEWPQGDNLTIKVAPAHTAAGNTIYAAFPRQFSEHYREARSSHAFASQEKQLDAAGYTVIPPSGTFRSLIRELDHILGTLGFRTILLLPIHPTPTTFARMGRFGSPFAGRDFLSVDPALAEFDTTATPLDQFKELLNAVHARHGLLFMDLPANHTGWAATFQTHHPEWYKRNDDGSFHSPGAWGVTWADLVELDYSHDALRRAMADVFIYWCRQGVNGFRCDAGYMIPVDAWSYIVARVREEFPDTVFLLEGLGGPLQTTDALLSQSHLDWAYSELFQTYDRAACENTLPQALALSQTCGPLVHFAETHDNNRLAEQGAAYARLRTALSALLSQQGAFGITAGVEWLATEKIDVHGASRLNWGATPNLVAWIRRLNLILCQHPAFGTDTTLQLIEHGEGNVLAARRAYGEDRRRELLILVNFELTHSQSVGFRSETFSNVTAYDLLTGRSVNLGAGQHTLQPAETLCLTLDRAEADAIEAAAHRAQGGYPVQGAVERARRVMAMRTKEALGEKYDLDDLDALGRALFKHPDQFCTDHHGIPRAVRFTLPEDLTRQVMVPPGFLLWVISPAEFRVQVAREDGTVYHTTASVPFEDGTHGAIFSVHDGHTKTPHTARLTFGIYAREKAYRAEAPILALPDPGHEKPVIRQFSGYRIRRDETLLTLLTNGTGAMSQIRLAWSALRSQYDCLLALNSHPDVPADRTIFFTRCRAWLRYNGYSAPIDSTCLEHFTADAAGEAAEWLFAVPSGMGGKVHIRIRLALQPGANRLAMNITRESPPEGAHAPADAISIILRPDIEWRNFHTKTKAFTGPEKEFPLWLHHSDDGFLFTPPGSGPLAIHTRCTARWHAQGEWTYMVPNPDEAARGQDASTDLYSPGWFELPLEHGQTATLIAGEQNIPDAPIPGLLKKLDPEPITLREAMHQAIRAYVVRRDNHKTVIAGYPWFLDWGRDTLIVLRGLIADGQIETAYDIMYEFGRFEKNGTLPNMIRGEDDANRETSDAPLWFGVCAGDLIARDGAKKVLSFRCGDRTLREILISIAENYLKGTPNGIRVDRESGLVFSPSHYTWMDTNYPAGTPREGYPVEIQALWVNLLDILARHVDPQWKHHADLARISFERLFALPDNGGLADCLRAAPGTPAASAVQDDAIRPNQLYAVTLGLLDQNRPLARAVIETCEQLLTPGSIRTLANRPVKLPLEIRRDGQLLGDPYRPYRGRYEGDEDTCRKPAYHNGTGWTFPFPLYAEALRRVYGRHARKAALAWVSSAACLVNKDCVTQLPECTQGNAPHEPCGTHAQAWGVSELLRVLIQLDQP